MASVYTDSFDASYEKYYNAAAGAAAKGDDEEAVASNENPEDNSKV